MSSIVLIWLTYGTLFLLMAVTIRLVYLGSKGNKSMADYALGSQGFSPWAVGLSLAASMTSAATFIINPGLIATYGISAFVSYGLVLPIAAMISLVWLTKGFRQYGQSSKALTMAQWMGQRYDSKPFTTYFAFLALLLITFIVLICVGLTQILSKALDASPLIVLAGIVSFIFGYMMFGGANSMVKTNTIQALLMLVVAIILLGSGWKYLQMGPANLLSQLAAIDPSLSTLYNPSSSLFRDFFEIFVCQAVIGIAIVCQPHIITKSLLLKDDSKVNTYLFAGVVVQSTFFLVVIAGIYARLSFPDLTIQDQLLKTDEIMSAYVVQSFHPMVSLLLILGLLSAGISTLEGLIQSLSTGITADLLKSIPFFNRFSDIQLIRVTIVFLGIFSFILSAQQIVYPKLSVALFAQNGVYAYFSAAFVPVLFGLFAPRSIRVAPILASIFAILTHFSLYYLELISYLQTPVKNPAIAAALAILGSLAVGLIVGIWEVYRHRINT